jgi:hypothetical protein
MVHLIVDVADDTMAVRDLDDLREPLDIYRD